MQGMEKKIKKKIPKLVTKRRENEIKEYRKGGEKTKTVEKNRMKINTNW